MTGDDKNKRKIVVPGRPLDVTVVVRDNASNMVVAIPYDGEVFVVFISPKLAARVMSNQEAHEFTKGIRDAYQSFHDDAKIREMEKEFEEHDE